jgi:hypothetical protein
MILIDCFLIGLKFLAFGVFTSCMPFYIFTTPIFEAKIYQNVIYYAIGFTLSVVLLTLSYGLLSSKARKSLVKKRYVYRVCDYDPSNSITRHH